MVEMKVNRGREHKKYREWFLVWKRGLKPSEKFGGGTKSGELWNLLQKKRLKAPPRTKTFAYCFHPLSRIF
jgi:hypothetical protein